LALLPRKKFNKEEADKLWKNYTSNLVNSITETEKEGLERATPPTRLKSSGKQE